MMFLIEISNNSVNPVKMAESKVKMTMSAITLGSFALFLNQRKAGAIIKYKKIEKTKGTNIVFIEYSAKVIPIAHNVIKLAGIILSLKGVIS
tara:strand:- start:324 stop:599 length:276 start_codon:yes stop_codon:yes gene_type:complete